MEENRPNFSVDLKPAQDDIALRQRQLHTQRKAQAGQTAAKPRSGLLLLVLLITLLASVVAGFSLWQLLTVQEKLNQADQSLFKLDSATQTLKESVSETGEKASLSTGALKDLIKENNGEIRKLWFVANDRNKKSIEAIDVQLEKLQANNAQLKKELTQALKKIRESTEAQLNSLGVDIAILKKELATAMPEMALRQGQNEEQLQQFEAKITALEQQLKQLEQKPVEIK